MLSAFLFYLTCTFAATKKKQRKARDKFNEKYNQQREEARREISDLSDVGCDADAFAKQMDTIVGGNFWSIAYDGDDFGGDFDMSKQDQQDTMTRQLDEMKRSIQMFSEQAEGVVTECLTAALQILTNSIKDSIDETYAALREMVDEVEGGMTQVLLELNDSMEKYFYARLETKLLVEEMTYNQLMGTTLMRSEEQVAIHYGLIMPVADMARQYKAARLRITSSYYDDSLEIKSDLIDKEVGLLSRATRGLQAAMNRTAALRNKFEERALRYLKMEVSSAAAATIAKHEQASELIETSQQKVRILYDKYLSRTSSQLQEVYTSLFSDLEQLNKPTVHIVGLKSDRSSTSLDKDLVDDFTWSEGLIGELIDSSILSLEQQSDRAERRRIANINHLLERGTVRKIQSRKMSDFLKTEVNEAQRRMRKDINNFHREENELSWLRKRTRSEMRFARESAKLGLQFHEQAVAVIREVAKDDLIGAMGIDPVTIYKAWPWVQAGLYP